MRENANTKARRYLIEGRLVIERKLNNEVLAHCRGNGQVYEVGHTTARGWYCDCPAKTRCCHLLALMAVVVAR